MKMDRKELMYNVFLGRSTVLKAIQESALTGEIGDGKIFVYSLEEAIRIRTGERGKEAL